MKRALLSSLGAIAIAAACGGTTVNGDGGAGDGGQSDGGPSPDVTACKGGGECVVVSQSCCGQCGAATKSDMVAINVAKLGSYRGQKCQGAACPACFMEQDPNLQAACVNDTCKAFIVNADPMSACTTSADCTLRYATCCETCDGSKPGLIAVAKTRLADYRAAVCAPDATCSKCAVQYPPDLAALCDTTTGHCMVAKALDAGVGD